MGKVKVLTPDVRSKIAAGEVIIRPVSVIKELIENSLDALAKRIDIEIEDGGKEKCLVNDDGAGMARDDARLSIERYATSKIESIDDIEKIKTFGFRGEALASIATVSSFTLETSDGGPGTRIEIEGGEIKGVFNSHRTRGTKIRVAKLFFNLPARRKFLKSGEWEKRLIFEMVNTCALINPDVYFSIGNVAKNLLTLPAVDSIKDRIKMLFSDIIDCLIPLNIELGAIKIAGFFSQPDFIRRHHFNYIYVNNRSVKYPRIYRTILETYQNPKNPPAFLLNLTVEPELVDINIHPTKREVKFKDERYIIDLLTRGIKKKIFSRVSPIGFKIGEPRPSISAEFVQESILPYEVEGKREYESPRDSSEFWQLHNTYIFAQTRSGLIILDQHVVHERIIYESIMKGKSPSQRLLFPITLDLTPEEFTVYTETKLILIDLGLEFKEFSLRTIVIDSLPQDVKIGREDVRDLFSEIGGLGKLKKERGEVAKVLACHGAIKAGMKLSVAEMHDLIDRLFACDNPYTCPHGRPTVLKFTLDDLGHRFGR